MPNFIRKPMWQIWHRLLLRFDKDSNVYFMNYGYENGTPVKLNKEDEDDRYCIQLYDHVVESIDLKKLDVLEVGSGRGGGASYITRYKQPNSYTAMDICKGTIEFCNGYYNVPGLKFVKGEAEKQPFKDSSFDAVVNVESARCYGNISTFFKEVHRVLRPEGKFLFADMVDHGEVEEIKEKLAATGFKIVSSTEITKNVVKALEVDNERREKMIEKKAPKALQSSFKEFAGVKGSPRFDSFSNGTYQYYSFVLQKN